MFNECTQFVSFWGQYIGRESRVRDMCYNLERDAADFNHTETVLDTTCTDISRTHKADVIFRMVFSICLVSSNTFLPIFRFFFKVC